jgi:hypothetical protein
VLRDNQLHAVCHGEHGVRALKELGRSYLTLTQDVSRVMNRIKAVYRSRATPCSCTSVYAPWHRAEWLWCKRLWLLKNSLSRNLGNESRSMTHSDPRFRMWS